MIVTTLREVGEVGVQTHVAAARGLFGRSLGPVTVVSRDSRLPVTVPLLLLPSLVIRRLRLTRLTRLNRALVHAAVARSIRRQFRRGDPRLVYAQDPLSAHAALEARGDSGAAVVLVVHYNESQAEELVIGQIIPRGGRVDRSIRAFEAELLPRLDGLVYVSEFMQGHVGAEFPAARNVPSIVVPNFLGRLDLPEQPSLLADCISVGMLVERKNHRYLLHVIAAARRAGHRYSLSLVGDGPERGPLQRLASELGIADLVSFLGARFDVEELLPQHRVYVHSALMENCPFALIEAFRAGLPVVTSRVGGIPELVGDHGPGRYWDLGDPAIGAKTLSTLLDDPEQLARSRKQALLRFATTYDADVVGEKLVKFLRSLPDRDQA